MSACHGPAKNHIKFWKGTDLTAKHHSRPRFAKRTKANSLRGEKAWAKWMSKVCNTFTMAQVRYLDHSEADAPGIGWKQWLDFDLSGVVPFPCSD